MDHRAVSQADRINATEHAVLRHVGGRMSPEMECPKLLWLKDNLPETWRRAAHFFDLVDFMSARATGFCDLRRSLCTLACKWTFRGHLVQEGQSGWSDDFFDLVGLGDLAAEGHARIGASSGVLPPGAALAALDATAAQEMGLSAGATVGVGIIDAHAGGLGVLGTALSERERACPVDELEALLPSRLAVISGTSTCHMAVSRTPRFVPGVWGPYWGAMVPGMWLTEGGQSATGSLLDFVIDPDKIPALRKALATAAGEGAPVSPFDLLNTKLEQIAKDRSVPRASFLSWDVHVLPYYHGNRSPRADPTLRGAVAGLSLSSSLDDLAIQYLAHLQAICYGTRHIIEELEKNGYAIETVFLTGGANQNRLLVQEIADITGCDVVLPTRDAVLLGAAVLAAVAGGQFASVVEGMRTMGSAERVVHPEPAARRFHDSKYRVFLRMFEDQQAYKEIMAQAAGSTQVRS